MPADNTKIGQKITMQVDLQQTDQMSIENWEKWVVGKSNFKIQIRTYRNDNYELSGLNNTGAAAIWSTNSNFTPDLDTTTPWNQAKAISVTKNDLLSLLKGNSGSKVLYYDDLTNYPIPEGGRVSFRYNADVRIWATDQSGTTVSKLCSRPKESTILTWFRPEPGEFGDFSSVPKVYSEIKEGSPQPSGTGSNETFDAMSGTPTTRSLYFASGGSEFIVDVQVEYVPKVTQTRSYKSEFISVPNGWAMEQKPGGWQNDSPPSKPEARVKIDACGAPYTENVTLEPGSYIKGTDSEGNPIEGQKYRWIQQGYPSTKVGGYTDTWTQTVTFDYMKINKAVVWKIERSKVDGMATLVGTNDITASITQGDPTFFYNRAASDTSAAGRLRYSVETDQHDSVYWSEGESDNCLTNSKDSGPKKEQAKFTERRNITGNVTAISDFLILQTSSGDQSVMYFEKPSNTAKVTEQLDVPITDFDTMWTNNPLSAAKWDKAATIKIGSYNGSFSTPTAKYSGGSTGTVATIFDSKPAGKNRTPRPSPYMRLMATNLDVPDTLSNGLYMTGTSTVFYRNVLNDNPKNKPTAYPVQSDATYGGTGLTFTSPYSPIHSKVNDVVIHDPVSVQHATVISLPSSLDQRTTPGGGNKQEGMAEYERVLDPNYRQNIIPNPDAEIINVDGTVAGWNKWVAKGSASNIAFTSRTGDTWVIGPGVHTFEINSVAVSGTNGGYWKDIPVKPNTVYKFEGDISCHRCEGYFALDFYDAGHQYAGVSAGSTDKVVNTGTVTRKSFTMTSPSNAAYLRIHMVKGDNKDTSHGRDHLFADNLSLKNMSLQEFVAVDSVEVTQVVPNPDYVAPQSGSTETFNFTGSTQYFTAPRDGTYTLEVWGAQGGYSNGGKGGYSKGSINLVAGQKIAVEVGGTNSYNGGGVSSGNGSGTITGGGATDIRTGSYSLSERIIVAGGGGGGGDASGGSGNNSAASYSLGSGQSYSHGCSNNVGPGGGGYYGGYSSTDGSSASSQGGSGYIGGVVGGIMQAGIRSGNGMAVITLPPVEEVGIPTKVITTTAGGSDTSPPSDAYILKAVTVNPNTPAGGYTPGNFVLLDYGFQLYFPNTGDFFGNGQWGWAQTTEIRGKGFTDGMDTTEWTKAKYVKFDFNVIYNNTMYKANEWIQLPVTSPGYLYDFYVPLANREKISAMVEWKSIAINSQIEDGDTPTNKVRYNAQRPYAAKHSTNKKYQVDVVGRIGNMVIEDTGDFRFSNLFKQPIDSTQWLVPKVVPQVNPNVQRWIIGDTVNIRGEPVSAGTRFLNTWGMLGHLEQNPIAFPLSPEKNSIPALRNQPLRFGYEVLSDIQTIGNYYSNMQITPYFYHVNLQNGGITPVDVYMNVDGMYKLINKNDGGQSAPDYANPVRLDWEAQDKRRNVTTNESDMTSTIAALFAQTGGDSAVGKAAEPSGSYMYGTSQLLELTGRNRTYIGRDATNGLNKNPGNRLAMLEYGMQAQRWHFSYVLPSSAVVVRKNQMPTQANIKALRNNTGVIVLAADIKAVGDTYTLQYKGSGNGSLNVAGVSWPLTGIPHPVIAVYSASKSSADDLKVSGTH
ncbi:glycine-rich protein [Cohnella panacarvi]|uniref:glycine-rich protein n=1 Tax=Cohnella panacarvi TaxID=400776 RepID=UPI00047AB086|nr:glycine-rich protein [Cohnella panacarvi]